MFTTRLRRCRPGSERVLRVRIVINELSEICEKIELQEWLGWRPRYNFAILTVLTIGRGGRRFSAKNERVFPLLRQPFRTDVRIPDHARGYERVGHFASGEREARETLVTAIRLIDENAVAVSLEGSAATGRATRCVVA